MGIDNRDQNVSATSARKLVTPLGSWQSRLNRAPNVNALQGERHCIWLAGFLLQPVALLDPSCAGGWRSRLNAFDCS